MDTLREVLQDLWAERRSLRAIWLLLMAGTMALTMLMGFGEGMHLAMDQVFRQSSDRMLRYSSGATTRPHGGLAAGRIIRPRWQDAAAVRALPGVAAVSCEFQLGAPVQAGARRVNVNVLGVEPDYAAIRGMWPRPGGRFLSAADLDQRRRVLCLGASLAADLFGAADPIGATVRVRDVPFTVVGVIADRLMVMNYSGEDAWKVYLPATTAMATFGVVYPNYLLVCVADPDAHAVVDAAVRDLLAARHGFAADDQPALDLNNHIAIATMFRGILVGTRVFLFLMGTIGLLITALAVGNAMFARVEEKRRALGLRRALGATRRGILGQQFLEAATVTLIGGGLGMLLATLVLLGLDTLPLDAHAKGYLGNPAPSFGTALAVAGLLGVTALVAGLQPARAAAAVPPVEALRHE